MAIWMPKQTAMTPSVTTAKASTHRKPRRCIHKIRNTSSAVQFDADFQRNPEEKIEPDRRADHLGEVGGTDGKLGERPERV